MKPVFSVGVRLILLGSLLWAAKCRAQLPVMTFEVITSKDGLPSNTVLSATRDHQGFMWFGTRQCPVRYDGSNFRSFTTSITNFVTGIAPDKNNNIWLASDRSGICKIEAHTMKMTCLSLTPDADVETTGDFYIDKFGQGWFSSHDGVSRINLATNERKHYRFRQTNFLWTKGAFVEDRDSTLWVIGRDNGLFRYERQQDSLYCILGADSPEPKQLKKMLMSSAYADQEGFIWIGTYNFGLIKFDPHTLDYKIFPTGNVNNQVLSVAEGWDEDGRRILWVGDEHGLGVFRPDQEKFYFFPKILPIPYQVNDIFRDPKDGVVWVCTSDGIIKYHPKSNMIQSISFPKDLLPHSVTVNVIHQDQRKGYANIFYLGLSHIGMMRWNRSSNQFSLIRFPEGRPDTRWIVQREDGTLWIGTNRWDYVRPGIFVYDLQQEKFLKPPLREKTNQYYSVPFFMYGSFGPPDKLWIGNSDEGVHAFDEKTLQEVSPWSATQMKDLIKDNNLINDMLVDRHGRLWLATFKGVYYYDTLENKFTCSDPPKLPAEMDDPAVNSLFEDSHGNLWAARWGSVTKMSAEGKLPTILTPKDGFQDRQNSGLAEDYAGNIWIGNHEGLYCFNPVNNRLTRFTMNDGLISNNTMKCIFVSGDKTELMIGQNDGFNVVKVNEVLKPLEAPLLAVSSFKIHEQEFDLDFSKPIQLNPSDNAFSVDFIALNFRKNQDNQYAYYLEGFQPDWNYSNSKHLAYYTNLNPGKYTLHIKAGDAFGNWNPDLLHMQIEVLPAFYQTVWFKIVIGISIACVLYALYRYRINQLLRLQQVRNAISADLHDELGSSLSGISIMGTLALKELPQQHPSAPFVERLMEEVDQISSSLDDIVWNISPRNDALSSLIARMTRYASELFEAKQINYKFSIPEQFEDIKLSMEQRRNFYLIFKESVNNLVKYSRCTQASVGVHRDRRSVFLTIEDNGIGFNPYAQTDRNGIQNLKSRAEILKGKLDIESTAGSGTTIRLEFPVIS